LGENGVSPCRAWPATTAFEAYLAHAADTAHRACAADTARRTDGAFCARPAATFRANRSKLLKFSNPFRERRNDFVQVFNDYIQFLFFGSLGRHKVPPIELAI